MTNAISGMTTDDHKCPHCGKDITVDIDFMLDIMVGKKLDN